MPYANPTRARNVDLEIIILNWNSEHLLETCLDALFGAEPVSRALITVVDNHSTDGSIAMLRRRFEGRIRLLESPENGGFARGNNLALRTSTARHAMLLNTDVTIPSADPHPLDQLLKYIDEHPEIGALGPRITTPAGDLEDSTGDRVALRHIIKNKLLALSGLPRAITGRISKLRWTYDRERNVDWVTGAALLVRGDVLRAGCYLDERYFMYTEDVEWCHRIRTRGWKVRFYPGVTIHHLRHGSSPATQSTIRQKILHREGILRFTDLHPSPWFLPLRLLLKTSLRLLRSKTSTTPPASPSTSDPPRPAKVLTD